MLETVKKIGLVMIFVAAIMVGVFLVGEESKKRTAEAKAIDNSLELSVGGEVKYYTFPQGSTIHVITDDNQLLTDIQVFTVVNDKNYLITPTTTKWQTNKPDN